MADAELLRNRYPTYSCVQALAKGENMRSFVLTPLGKENGTAVKPEEELKEMKEAADLQSCHLVTHNESQGVYIPLEMKEPLHCEKTHPGLKILGGLHGSALICEFDWQVNELSRMWNWSCGF